MENMVNNDTDNSLKNLLASWNLTKT